MADPKYVFVSGSGSSQFVERIEMDGRSFTPKSLTGGAGKCSDRTVLGRSSSDVVSYKLYVRHYRSLDAVMQGNESTNEQYAGSLHLSDLEPGCNTIVVDKPSRGGPGLGPVHPLRRPDLVFTDRPCGR